VDDLGMENVLRLQLKFASLLSIAEQQGSFIGKGRTKVNGNDFGKIEKNLTIFQNTSDDVLKQNGQDLKLVMSNKASDFSNNSNTGISVNFNDEINTINTWSDSKNSDLNKNTISPPGEKKVMEIHEEEINEEKKTTKSIPSMSNVQVPMSEESLIPAENLNSGSNLIKQLLLIITQKLDLFKKNIIIIKKRSSFLA